MKAAHIDRITQPGLGLQVPPSRVTLSDRDVSRLSSVSFSPSVCRAVLFCRVWVNDRGRAGAGTDG